jgi:hypothetical protein
MAPARWRLLVQRRLSPVGRDELRMFSRRCIVVDPFNLEACPRKHDGYEYLVPRALERAKILQSRNERFGQPMSQLQPIQIVGKTLVGVGRSGKSVASADAVACVSRPAKQLKHCSAPFHDSVLILERKEKLLFKPILAERAHYERIEELMKRLVLRIVQSLFQMNRQRVSP